MMIRQVAKATAEAAKRAAVAAARDVSYFGLLLAAYRKAAHQPINPRKVIFVVEKGEGIPSA